MERNYYVCEQLGGIGDTLSIGADLDGKAGYFSGYIGDFRIYNRALTDSEIMATSKV